MSSINENTQHSLSTGHSFKTPHKFPISSSTDPDDESLKKLANLSNQLYPTGRVWNLNENTKFSDLHESINVSFLKVINDFENLIDSSIPDNENFTLEDAAFLEFKYGISNFNKGLNTFLGSGSNNETLLNQKKASISRKMGHPNNVRPRQDLNFIQGQLRSSGFDVTCYENEPAVNPDGSLTYQDPASITGNSVASIQHGEPTQHADSTFHGGTTFDVIANEIENNESYGVGDNLWASFFIGGETLGQSANVPENRRREFRELVLKLKPAHLAAYIFINFV